MSYLKYYNILRLHIPTKNGLLYVMVFAILNLILWNLFFTGENDFTMNYSFLATISIFVASMYAYQIRFNPSHPIYQFPLNHKDRVKNDYLSAPFSMVLVSIGLMVFGIAVVLIISLFSNLESNSTEDIFYILGTLYSITYLLIVYALFMPISYIHSIKRRYIYGSLSIFVLAIINFINIYILTGDVFETADIRILLQESDYGIYIVISLFIVSALSIFFSYDISKKLNRYK